LSDSSTACLHLVLTLWRLQVLYESKSLIHGIWPAFTCRKGVGEGFVSRLAYTWIGVIWLSIGFYLFAIGVYSALGRLGPSQLSQFTGVASHILTTRSLSWMLIVFVPIVGISFDVCGKLFSNMFYPTQTQIHIELENASKETRRKRRMLRASSWRRSSQQRSMAEP
jgi:hypothetical protein